MSVYVGQSPYHDNDQGVCGFPLIVSRVERHKLSLARASLTQTHTEKHDPAVI